MFIHEVLHGVLHPEAHNNGFKKKREVCLWVSKIKDYMTYGAEHLYMATPASSPLIVAASEFRKIILVTLFHGYQLSSACRSLIMTSTSRSMSHFVDIEAQNLASGSQPPGMHRALPCQQSSQC